ncbi:DUF5615 family PIN-like protein [Nostoc sp.]|uniref:DUF5615 family PIN-like protein n=1 Tax=Nostoc sp. TaxID=1180 RepID=UPI002FF601A9
MKLLLDECIDRKLAREFVGYEVQTVPQMGWAGVKNGQFLALAEANFDVFITVDRNLSFQQNLPQFDIAVIVLQDIPSQKTLLEVDRWCDRLQGLCVKFRRSRPLSRSPLLDCDNLTRLPMIVVTRRHKKRNYDRSRTIESDHS